METRRSIFKRQWMCKNKLSFTDHDGRRRHFKQLDKDEISARYEGIPRRPSQYISLWRNPPRQYYSHHLAKHHMQPLRCTLASRKKPLGMSRGPGASQLKINVHFAATLHDARQATHVEWRRSGRSYQAKSVYLVELSSKAKGDGKG
jgi:hypothetical protein